MFDERVEYSLKVTLGVRAGFNLESRLGFFASAELFESFVEFQLLVSSFPVGSQRPVALESFADLPIAS